VVPWRKEQRYNDSGTTYRGERARSMMPLMLSPPFPLPSAAVAVSRARPTTAIPVRVSSFTRGGWALEAWEEAELNYALPGCARWLNCY